MVIRRGMTLAAFGVTLTDPATLGAAVVALILSSLVATYVPAARAAMVAPASVLKAE